MSRDTTGATSADRSGTGTGPLIDPNRVVEVFEACQWRDDDSHGDRLAVEAIANAEFDSDRLAEHRDEITTMLDGLPSAFKSSVGGGYSFLNGCMDANDEQWTGLQRTVEMLFLLGIGIDRVSLLLPREMWGALPGGMPYYVVEDAPA